jgi:hypothetical protein
MSLREPPSWFSYCLAGFLVLAGCSSVGAPSDGLSFDVVLEGGGSIHEVDWRITDPAVSDQLLMEGSIDTSAPGSTVSVEAYGLPPGGPYVIHLSAASADGTTNCKSSTQFDIAIGLVTELHMVLRCKTEPDSGAVRVGAGINVCARLDMVAVSSLTSSVEGSIDVSAMASDEDRDPISYSWTATAGSFGDRTAAETTFACGAEGIQFLTIEVSDAEHCMDSLTVAIECIGGGMGTGGAGGEGGAGGDQGALRVVETIPEDMETGVATELAPGAVFSDALLEATVTTASFAVRRAQGEAVEGAVSARDEVVSFVPNRPLALRTEYTGTLSTAIESLSGQSLATDFSWRFTTRDGRWGTAELIEVNDRSAFGPQIAIDPNGDALSVWDQSDGTRISIWANRYTPNAGWGTAELIEMNDEGNANGPQIAMDVNGNALSVWAQSDSTRTSIWANRYTPTTGWGTAELIEMNDEGNVFVPQIAVDLDGNALSVWQQTDGMRTNLWANRYTPGGGWGTAELIETNDAGNAGSPQIAIDPSGNATCVWGQSDGRRTNIWANRYTPTTGWGTAELIEMNDAGDAFLAQIAVDPKGNALSVWLWQQSDRTRFRVWGNRYTPSTGWATAERIETNVAGNASSAQIAMDSSGNGLAVWRLSDGTRNDVWANRYTPSAGWGTAERIEVNDASNTSSAQIVRIAIDPNGNALGVWDQSNGTGNSIWANRFGDIETQTE